MKNDSFLDDSQITLPVVVDRDTITGFVGVPGLPVTIKRYLKGWTPWLSITVNGCSVHDTDATQAERDLFDLVLNRAHDEADARHAFNKAKAKDATRGLFAKY